MVLQFKVNNNLYLGGGLNNFGGISRGNGQGTINMLTIDNNRADWTTYGLSDHNSSHVGMFAKGRFGKLNYRLSINDAAVNTFDGNHLTELQPNDEKYLGEAILGKGKYAYSGYFDYQFFDQESNVLPYRVGTYLGAKKVFNIGAGFFNHNDALVKNVNGNLVSGNFNHYAIDAFYDSPIGESGAITAYAKFQNSEMGDNYVYGDVVGNGNQVSGHVGYLIPKAIKEGQNKYKNRLQPYVAYSYRNFTALPKPAEELKVGANWYIDGLNARLGIEYQKSFHAPKNANEVLTIQALIVI